MPIRFSDVDREGLAMRFVAEYPVDLPEIWSLWSDPRRIERWWGPPGWPAAFSRHELTAGGESRYRMTGPEGEISTGWFRTTRVESGRLIAFDDGFADPAGEPDPSMPTLRFQVELERSVDGTTRMTTTIRFDDEEAFDMIVGMGMLEGMSAAMGQIDALLGAR